MKTCIQAFSPTLHTLELDACHLQRSLDILPDFVGERLVPSLRTLKISEFLVDWTGLKVSSALISLHMERCHCSAENGWWDLLQVLGTTPKLKFLKLCDSLPLPSTTPHPATPLSHSLLPVRLSKLQCLCIYSKDVYSTAKFLEHLNFTMTIYLDATIELPHANVEFDLAKLPLMVPFLTSVLTAASGGDQVDVFKVDSDAFKFYRKDEVKSRICNPVVELWSVV